ncbi:MAG: DEAD/DEAH box helicase family protein [Sporolactobacillus sp.]|jgi:superfamily II DNA or RNA helicase|nr:DEAD/DEAH box helicase family protein [Sporolactobacillus sp.]
MGLKEQTYLTSYNKADHDIAEMFYLPCMRNAVFYDRISGYFGSTIYIIVWDALREFIENDGKIRLVCSPYVSDEDAAALANGYSAKNDEILASSLAKEVQALFGDPYLTAPAKLLAYMISKGIIDVKIAIPTGNESPNSRRLFHDKVGIFTDREECKVGFRGSMNETFKGLSSDGNMESIDVFPNWLDSRDAERVDDASDFFEKLWAESVQGIIVYRFPNASKEILRTKAEGVQWRELLDEIHVIENKTKRWKPSNHIGSRTPRPHQINALDAWVKNSRRGILEHATGSGKTFTAMCAIHDAFKRNEVVLVLVPSRDLLKQWNRELRKTLLDDKIYYLLCGDNNSEWKKPGILASWTSDGGSTHRIILATMDTACSEDFIKNISQGKHLFVVADEVHRLGSPRRRNALNISTGARLGLSATPRRYGDPEGTSALFEYFGGLVPPPYTLNDAIKSGVLTKYFYNPLTIELTDKEQKNWNDITNQISKLIARLNSNDSTNVNITSNTKLKQLLIKRARIVKNASGKKQLAINLLRSEYKEGQSWIIYCDNITQLKAVLNKAIDAGFDAFEYYADMAGDRDETLRYFSKNGGVLVSIKCLDEGVDIPSTTHALILASSQNPREFIQRRGRILRNSPGKLFAHLYDAITVPVIEDEETPKSMSIIMGELSRAIHFGMGAENPACITDLKNIAVDFQIDYNNLQNTGIEEEDDND